MDILLDGFHRLAPWAFAALLGMAAWCDARTYEIPDRFSLLIALLYGGYALAGAAPAEFAAASAVAAVVFAVAAGFFAMGLMGGGDVKLMAATALWAGPGLVAPFVLATAVAGGVLALVFLARRRIAAGAGREIAGPTAELPYGIAIAAGGMLVAARLVTPPFP